MGFYGSGGFGFCFFKVFLGLGFYTLILYFWCEVFILVCQNRFWLRFGLDDFVCVLLRIKLFLGAYKWLFLIRLLVRFGIG